MKIIPELISTFFFMQMKYPTTQVQKKANKTDTKEQDISIMYTETSDKYLQHAYAKYENSAFNPKHTNQKSE